jgi:hypothetical protein
VPPIGETFNLSHCFNWKRREQGKDMKGRKKVKDKIAKEIVSWRISNSFSILKKH